MKAEEKLQWFWAAGFLPGTMFDDWNEKLSKQHQPVVHRRVNWPEQVGLRRIGKGFVRDR